MPPGDTGKEGNEAPLSKTALGGHLKVQGHVALAISPLLACVRPIEEFLGAQAQGPEAVSCWPPGGRAE